MGPTWCAEGRSFVPSANHSLLYPGWVRGGNGLESIVRARERARELVREKSAYPPTTYAMGCRLRRLLSSRYMIVSSGELCRRSAMD